MTVNPNNLAAPNTEDKIYVSVKHYARKVQVEEKNSSPIIGRPGPIAGIVLTYADIVIYFVLKFFFYMYDIGRYSFEWIGNMAFGNFSGIIPKSFKKGKVITTKFFRYTLNVLMPPFGIMLSKGVFGWFSILVCTLITYVNFFAGIVYAFVITSRNRYADQFEEYQKKKYSSLYSQQEATEDISAFVSSLCVIGMIGLVFFFIFSYF